VLKYTSTDGADELLIHLALKALLLQTHMKCLTQHGEQKKFIVIWGPPLRHGIIGMATQGTLQSGELSTRSKNSSQSFRGPENLG
jgi:hypothetical protein